MAQHEEFLRLAMFASICSLIVGNDTDRFNYRETVGTDFGPADWHKVSCNDLSTCTGWPDGWELGVGWELEGNRCEWCPAEGGNCGLHRQSPIDLLRSEATTGHDTECYDYHWMAYQDGSCLWHDLTKNGFSTNENNFHIRRHALQIEQPIDEHGNLRCNSEQGNLFPRLDYSKGFPNWWFLSHTEITVPSEHTQEGKRFDAEVHLAHFYSVDHQRKVGKVAIFLEADSKLERWDFLDKLICQWREVEEEIRDECGLESVPPYPGCRNPTRETGETDLPAVDPYPFIDCDSVENSERICKSTSCCESERNTGNYCQNDVYSFYGDDTVGSICWWCCPGKLLAPADSTTTPTPTPQLVPTQSPVSPTEAPTGVPTTAVATDDPTEPPITTPPTTATPTTTTQAPQSPPTAEPTTSPTETTPTPQLAPTQSPVSPTESPTSVPTTAVATDEPTEQPITTPPTTATPTTTTQAPQSPPTTEPTTSPTETPQNFPTVAPSPPGGVVCSDYDSHPEINMGRICKDGGCCDSTRSATDHCHAVYKFFGDSMTSICSDCCSPSKELAPAPPPHPHYSPIDCTSVDNPFRICKPTSCCNAEQSTSPYCLDVYERYGNEMGSICWYCCSEPKEVDPTVFGQTEPPTNAPFSSTESPTESPQAYQTDAPVLPTLAPQVSPTAAPSTATHSPTTSPTSDVLVCSNYDGHPTINIARICKDGGCCESTRSASNDCHQAYQFFGGTMDNVCTDCCSKTLAPPPPTHPTYPPIDCTTVDNPFRICKDTSCCNPAQSTSSYCQGIYETYGSTMGSVCWYCCSEPKEVDSAVLELISESATAAPQRLPTDAPTSPPTASPVVPTANPVNPPTDAPTILESQIPSNAPVWTTSAPQIGTSDIGDSSRYYEEGRESGNQASDVTLPQGFQASELSMDPANFEVTPDLEAEYLNGIDEYKSRQDRTKESSDSRHLAGDTGDNYINVPYSPYEWMREVNTEYYFRYEGSQMVPPCYETVHYRVMKDPIRIHPVQLAELERLLAWRIAPKGSSNECEVDTAGRDRPDNNNAVDLNRPLQSYSNIHRKVFCECTDWDSKFVEDQDWCNLSLEDRMYNHPYNFEWDQPL